MPLPVAVQDQLNATNTNIVFESIDAPNGVNRLLHNGTDVIRLNNSGVIRYYQTNGTAKVNYAIGGIPTSGIVEDIAFDYNTDKIYALYSVPAVTVSSVTTGSSFYYDSFTQTGIGLNPATWSGYSNFSVVSSGLVFSGIGSGYAQLKGGLSTTPLFKTIKLNLSELTMSGAEAPNYADRFNFTISGSDNKFLEAGIIKNGSVFNLYEFDNVSAYNKIYNFYTYYGTPTATYLTLYNDTFNTDTNFKAGNLNLRYHTTITGSELPFPGNIDFCTYRNDTLVDTKSYPWYLAASGTYMPPPAIVSGNFVVYTYTGIEGTVLDVALYNPPSNGVWAYIPTLTESGIIPAVGVENYGQLFTDEAINPSGIFSISLSGGTVIYNNSNQLRSAVQTFSSFSQPKLSLNVVSASGTILKGDGFLANLYDSVTTSSVVTVTPSRLEIKKLNLDGTVSSVVTSGFNPQFGGNNLIDASTVREIAVNEQNPYIYVRLGSSLIRMNNTTYTGSIDETTPGIVVSYDSLEHFNNATNSLFYNKELDKLTYMSYDGITDETRLLTVDPITLATLYGKVFLNISNFSTVNYPVFYEYPDYNSLFNLRGSALYHFNVDPNISAFSAMNVSDYSLPAGTGAISNVLVSVINSWGLPLGGKNVNFQILSGDGVISPSAVTDPVTGVASGNYTAGLSVGTVQIQATISD